MKKKVSEEEKSKSLKRKIELRAFTFEQGTQILNICTDSNGHTHTHRIVRINT